MDITTGAAWGAGNAHPFGAPGPLIWYQKFEYAMGHWLWKTAEHVFGSVLCAPGCFSLYRASALLSGDVLETFSTLPSSPREYLQFDQGEDRWLCTLLLKEGLRIEYVAESSAKTVAPENLSELLRQRRRWLSSTMANLFDLQECSKFLRENNTDISLFYILYLMLIVIITTFTPSVILWGIQVQLLSITKMETWFVYGITYGPALFHFLVCFKCKSKDLQHSVTFACTIIYSCIMILLFVNQIMNINENGFSKTSVVFFVLYVLMGLLHISEIHNLFYFIICYILSPLGYILMYTYTVCNINDISWGTREMKSEKDNDITEPTQNNQTNSNSCKDIKIDNSEIISIQEANAVTTRHTQHPGEINAKIHAACNTVTDHTSEEHMHCIKEEEKQFWETLIFEKLRPIKLTENTKSTMITDFQQYKSKCIALYMILNCSILMIRHLLDIFKQKLSIKLFSLSFKPFGFLIFVAASLLSLLQIIGLFIFKYESFLHNISRFGRTYTE